MGRYFGTDGFRGEANDILTADKAYKIGRFLGWYYTKQSGRPARIVIGKDTRRSSYMFEYAISAGVAASGADAYLLHVTTTPSVSYVTRLEDFDCGVMISASHNPCYDNGIKLVDGSGVKMDDDTIDKIEKYLDGDLAALGVEGGDIPLARREKIGRSIDYAAGRNRYIGYLISLAAVSFKDYKVGLDCANGSAWMIARSVFEALGARTYVIGAEPNGDNINLNVGSTHIEALKRFVREKGLDIGFAYDGDADRCIAVDECGNEVNGDHIMYIFARDLKDEGRLANNTVVTTIMSNMGLYRALREAGIDYVQTTVGDKYVYENMQQFGHVLGGEQSGHIILGKYATTDRRRDTDLNQAHGNRGQQEDQTQQAGRPGDDFPSNNEKHPRSGQEKAGGRPGCYRAARRDQQKAGRGRADSPAAERNRAGCADYGRGRGGRALRALCRPGGRPDLRKGA